MTAEVTTIVRCPHCKTAFRALPEHAGRRAKCSHCGGTIVVPGEPVKPKQEPDDAPQPQYVGVNCMLCGTRMYGTLADVGTELKCPDCGRMTKLPPPEIKKKNIPAALEGEQYELWDGDDQPWGVTLSAEGPRYIAVECRLCQTHLQATLDLVGKKIRCPDCGAETEVRLPADGARAKKPPKPVDEYEVDETIAPIVPPNFYFPTDDNAPAAKREPIKGEPPRRDEPLDAEFKERPKLPRWPLLTGNVAFLASPGVPIRLLVMSASILVPSLLVAIFNALSGGFSAVQSFLLFAPTIAITLVWFAAMVAASMAIVSDSSQGSDEVYAWPSSAFMDWLPELGTMLLAFFVGAFPGWAIARLSPELTQMGFPLMAFSTILFFPVVLLSQLALNSVFAILSPVVVMSWFRCPLSWIGFYLQGVALLAIVGGLGIATLAVTPWLALLLIPLVIASTFYYFRIMGRLAWVISESTPMPGDDEEDEDGSR
jgi:DNA-directed RNA polymerase subunit RPC12/RpoP